MAAERFRKGGTERCGASDELRICFSSPSSSSHCVPLTLSTIPQVLSNTMTSPILDQSQLMFSWIGAFITFAAYQNASGNAEVVELYILWIERLRPSTIAERFGRLLGYLLFLSTAMLIGGYTVGTADIAIHSSGVSRAAFLSAPPVSFIALLLWVFFWFAVICWDRIQLPQPTWPARLCTILARSLIPEPLSPIVTNLDLEE